MGYKNQVRVDCEVHEETARALHVTVEDGRELYIPFSAINEIHRADGWIMIDEWLAKKENLL